MRRFLKLVILLAVVAVATGLWLTRPVRLPPSTFDGLSGDSARGEVVFAASATCARSANVPLQCKITSQPAQSD